MNKLLLSWAAIMVAFSVFGQGVVRRVNTVIELQTIDPSSVGTSGRVTYEVLGYTSTNLWPAPRIARWDSTSAATVDNVKYFATATSGRWVFDDVSNGSVDVTWANAIGNGVANDTAAIQLAASLVTAGNALTAPPGRTFILTDTVTLTNNNVTVDFNGSIVRFNSGSRKPAFRIGPALILLSGLNFTILSNTNLVTGVPAATFADGDMVLLYNSIEEPADYNPGQFAFITDASGTTMTLDRFPAVDMNITNAYRYPLAPYNCVVRNVNIDLANAVDGIGIAMVGHGHLVERCRINGTGLPTDSNYIGIDIRGQGLTARKNYVIGILDADNAADKAGYGIFMAGDSVTVEDNEIYDCKHTIATSERHARSTRLRMLNNICRQRGDWEMITDSLGALMHGNLDVHANVDNVLIQGNYCESWGRWNANIRNGNFDVIDNYFVINTQTNLPFAQQQLGFNEALTKRAVLRGNHFITPDSALTLYFGHRGRGYNGVHSNILVAGNTFEGGLLAFQDMSGTNSNPFVGVSIVGNQMFRHSKKTPLLLVGTMTNFIITGNSISYGTNGNAITVSADGSAGDSSPARQIYIANNFFNKDSAGTGYDVSLIAGPTNIVALGENRWAASLASYVPPVNGIDGAIPVGMYNSRDTYPRIIGTYNGKLKFGDGAVYPSSALSQLYNGALQSDAIIARQMTNMANVAFATYNTTFSNYFDFSIRGDGQLSYRVTNTVTTNLDTSIVIGPRRYSDLTNGVWRLTGLLGITENAQPIQPEGNTATLWLENATTKALKIRWPDGTIGSLWHAYNDGTGSGLDADTVDGNTTSWLVDRANHTGTQSYTTITGLGQLATVDDAPIDGLSYGRKNGAWSQVVDSTHTHTVSNITGLGPLATSDAPTNGLSYGRNNGAWSQVADAFHTHDASDTVTGEFDPGLLGTGTADTDTFLSGGGGGSQSWRQVLTNDVGGLSGWMATKSDTGHTHAASNIVSGTLAAERLGTGTATTNTFLQGNGSNPPFWGTIPSTPSPTNGIADAPADGVFYGRKNNSWTQPDVSDLSGISSWGMSWIDGTVVDEVDALTTLTLVGGSPSTIESPARYSVRVNSGGSPSIRHRLNLIASGGLSLSLSDDGVNDESDTTISIQDGGITTNKVASTFHQWIYDKTLSLHGTVIDEPNITDTATVEVTAAGPNIAFTVPNDSITYSKLQNVSATNRVIGLGSTAPGSAVELAVGDGLITTTTDLRVNIEAGSGIEFATNGSKKITIASKGYTPANDAVANLLLVTTSETTDNNQDATWRDVTPSARSGMSATIPGGTLLSGSVMKVELSGVMDAADANWEPQLRMIFDGPTASDYTITFIMNEPGSWYPYETTTWKAEAFIVVASAGSPATVRQRSFSLWADGAMSGSGSLAGYGLMTSGQSANSLDTAADNTFRLEYQAVNANMQSFSVTSVVIWML